MSDLGSSAKAKILSPDEYILLNTLLIDTVDPKEADKFWRAGETIVEASVDCADYEMFEKLPKVIEVCISNHTYILGLSGWNSDINAAFYHNKVVLGKVIK